MISWTAVCFKDMLGWFSYNATQASNYSFNECAIENKFRDKVGFIPPSKPMTTFRAIFSEVKLNSAH